ncbi:hypothetical protein OHB26_35185 [Nocardia sp. NBC_01503]|uniref:hypothetical protein n=1 Tax=Nocardia sp. NBC_01503 TaxID=2975997 RepID=UPI002E7C0EBA|nr:hypothetical protein [Nocardia sp. NBC_01503]WTL32083.1 hypothetical protein OHB26_35185 [Nocardia sp. NBC_01503]
MNGNSTLARATQGMVRQLAWSQALARIAIGTGMLTAPAVVSKSWSGEYDEDASSLPTRAFGTRDVVIGLGTIWSLRRGHPVRHWFILGVALELVDATVTLNKRERLGVTGRPDTWELLTAAGLAGGVLVAVALRE